MPIEVNCPECHSLLRIADENAGRQARCPSCSAVFTAEARPATPSSATPSTPFGGAEAGTGGAAPLNPYASSSFTEPARDYAPSDWAPRTITPDEVFSKSWAIFKDQWLMASVAILIVGGINFGLNMLEQLLVQGVRAAANDQAMVVGSQIVTGFIRWVLQMWLQIGQVIVMLDIARGRGVNLSKIFSGAPFLLNTIFAMILVSLIVGALALALVVIPAGVVYLATQDQGAAFVAGGIGMLIAVTPIVIVSLMLSQIQLLIIDRGLDAIQSLKVSREITNGNKLNLFLIFVMLTVLGFAAAVVGILLLCIGLIPAMIGYGAFAALVIAVAYLCMTGQAVVVPQKPATPGQAGIAAN